jgi:L-galactose dehydrogenase
MEYRQLGNTDMQVSVVSFGASSLGSVFRKVTEAEGIAAVHAAIDLGINFIDVSPFYGLTLAETMLGRALKSVPRDKYFLATKVGRYGYTIDDFDFSAERVTTSVDESLERLGIDTIDIIQCHDIEFGNLDQVVEETIPALRRLQAAGKVRYVGITGLPLHVFTYVAERVDIDTILSYCRYELNDTGLANLVPFLQAKGIGIINASPLGMGLLTQRGAPDWHPASPEMRQICAQAAEHCAAKGVDIAQLAVQFSLANPDFATTLIGTASASNVAKNVQWAELPLDEELVAEVLEILAPIANQTWPSGRPENNDPA